MSEAAEMATAIRARLPRLKAGSLRFWGDWFGRPHDNFHRVVSCRADGDRLTLVFDGGETLSVWSPAKFEESDGWLRIHKAEKMRWEWYFYGRPRVPENLCFIEYEANGTSVTKQSNTDRESATFDVDAATPAVEMC